MKTALGTHMGVLGQSFTIDDLATTSALIEDVGRNLPPINRFQGLFRFSKPRHPMPFLRKNCGPGYVLKVPATP